MSARGLPRLTLNLWEVGDGPDPDQVGYFVLAATMDDAARDRWGAGIQLGPNRAGVRIVSDAKGTVVGFIRTGKATIVLPDGYPGTVSGATIDFAAARVAAAA